MTHFLMGELILGRLSIVFISVFVGAYWVGCWFPWFMSGLMSHYQLGQPTLILVAMPILGAFCSREGSLVSGMHCHGQFCRLP